MFKETDLGPLDALLEDLLGGETVTTEDRLLIKTFLELSDDSRKAVIEFVQKCARELSSPAANPAPDGDLASRVAALERENRELRARLNGVPREETTEEYAERMKQEIIAEKKAEEASEASTGTDGKSSTA